MQMHALNRVYSAFKSPPHRWLTWRQSCSGLFVGGLSYDTNESVLKGAFEEYGEVIEVKVICDRVSGKSRGYGFVHYSSEMAANKALKEMDGRLLDGRNIHIHYAYRRERQGSQGKATSGNEK
ncbi:glycine-rich RNA-binding protein 4, mitochondrial isoform X2 [Sesamum indicum]|uniref:Glycine-rich RNA-binding protein 4, mitochondrial isoform X2 n=1 Tax=Sesamum indicum TaxID=4182 RepID=A0A6I9TS89_SESIN|nr:glycine-rich RNA-binding protein 4, mitochondrial isoform X2 [Sesamum indicum]